MKVFEVEFNRGARELGQGRIDEFVGKFGPANLRAFDEIGWNIIA